MNKAQSVDESVMYRPKDNSNRMRWVLCALLFLATTTNYMDRVVLGILAPLLEKDMHWTENSYGNMVASFTFAYALAYLLSGRIVDRFGTRRGYGLFVGIWSLSSLAHAFVHSVVGFGTARFFLGIGESGNFPAALKAVAEWFPKEERALATGIFNSGTNFAALLAPALIPYIALRWGWRYAFVFTAGLSMLWLILWMAFPYNRLRPHGELLTQSAVQLEELTEQRSFTSLLLDRGTLAFAAGKFLTDPAWWFYLFWGPKFLSSQFHMSLKQMSIPLTIIYFGASFGSILGGWLSGMWMKRGHTVNFSRKAAMAICGVFALPVVMASHIPNFWITVAVITVAAAAHQGWSANIFSTPSDLFRAGSVATVVGIGGTAGALGGTVFAKLAGYMLNRTHNYSTLFVICGCSYLVAMLFFQVMVPQLSHNRGRAATDA
ncbi:MAG TPA: MFS transporter [Acidisarcina sp.]|nr:MFS transporter [Acidisarcina sp.]